MVNHGCCKTIAAAAIATTPVATVRAATSLTGLGKLKTVVGPDIGWLLEGEN